MDMLQRYVIPGYIFSALLVIFSEPAFTALGNSAKNNKFWLIILGAIAGLPIGYVLGQISTFLFHIIPAFSVVNKVYNPKWSPIFITRTVADEARLYCARLDKAGSEFNLSDWLDHRWSYLIVSFNII